MANTNREISLRKENKRTISVMGGKQQRAREKAETFRSGRETWEGFVSCSFSPLGQQVTSREGKLGDLRVGKI